MIIETPTPNIEETKIFYNKLGFSILNDNHIITDGKAIIQVNEDRQARPAIRLYSEDWTEVISKLKPYTPIISKENFSLVFDSSGTWIKLTTKKENVDIQNSSPSIIGSYAGVSLECTDIQKSLSIFNILGFELSMGGVEQGWVALSNKEGATVSLMKVFSCPHLFFSPSLTYFNGKKNLEIIENIRQSGVEITEEISHFNKEGIVDNIIIRDPGGLGFFIFSD